MASCNFETLALAGENTVVVGEVEQEECKEVARVGDSLDAQGGSIEAKSGDQHAFVELEKEGVSRLFVGTGEKRSTLRASLLSFLLISDPTI
jgi:hypothetical protein